MPMAYTRTSLSRMSRFTAVTVVRLAVSFPSEITSRAFFAFCPFWASGIASATVSYMAVPPLGAIRPSARVSS